MSYILFLVPVVTSLSEITLPQLLPFAIPAAIVAPFITYALAKRSDTAKRKLEYRTFIDVSELEDTDSLANQHKKPGTKVIVPDNMPPIGPYRTKPDSLVGYASIPIEKYKYLKIKSFGKSIVTSGSLSIEAIDLYTGKLINYNIMLPILNVDEEIFITLYECTGDGNKFLVSAIEIKYRTQAGEEMIYRRNSDFTKSQDIYYTDFHRVKKRFSDSEILEKNEGTSSNWRYI